MRLKFRVQSLKLSFRFYLLLFSFLVSHFSVLAQIEIPKPGKDYVNDYAGALSSGDRANLNERLKNYEDSTSTQIAIIIEATLDGYDVIQFSYDLGDKWGVGGKKDNGVVITVSLDEHKAAITPGKAMEGVLPDVTCKQIISDYLAPAFKQKNYYAGLNDAVTQIILAPRGEFKGEKKSSPFDWTKLIFIGIFLIVIFVLSRRGGGGGGGVITRGGYFAPMLFGGYGRGFGGGGSFGGGSSGGFGGWGGGSFGGGGASGSW